MTAGISAGSVFVSIKADMGPFRAQLAGLQKSLSSLGAQMSASLKFPEQAKRTAMSATRAAKAVDTLAWRFDNLAVSIAGANRQLSMMMANMQKAGIRFTRMGNAVQAVKNSSAALEKANPVPITMAQRLDAINKRMYYLSRGLNQAANAALGFSAAMFGGVVLAGRAFISFEKEITRVQILTNTTGKEFNALAAEAMRLGAVTSFTAGQAAEGMKELAQGGMDAREILSSIGAVLNLAKIGDMGLGDAAKIIIRVSNAFGLLAQDAGFVSDVIAKAAMSSSSSVSDMAGAFRYVAGTARQLNQSIEETGTLLAVLADNGIPATMAGRTLNQAFRQLLQKQGAIQKLFGVALQDPNTGGLRRFSEIIKDINKSASGMTGLEKQTKLFELFGVLGGRAVSALMQSGDALDEMGEKVRDNAGFAENVTKKLMDTFEGTYLRMKAAVEAFAITLIQAVSPALTKIMNEFAAFANRLAKNPELLRKYASDFLAILSNVVKAAIAFKLLAGALRIAYGAMLLAQLAMQGWDKVGSYVMEAATIIRTHFIAAMVKITTFDVVGPFRAVLGSIGQVIAALRKAIVTQGVLNTATAGYSTIWAGIKATAAAGVAGVGAIFTKIFAAIGVGVAGVAGAFVVVLTTILSVLAFAWKLNKYFDDTAAIEKTKKAIEDMRNAFAKAREEGAKYQYTQEDATAPYLNEIKTLKRLGKTHNEITASMRKNEQQLLTLLGEMESVRGRAAYKGDKEGVALLDDTIQMYKTRIESLRKLLSGMSTSGELPALPVDAETAKAWDTAIEKLKERRDEFFESVDNQEQEKQYEAIKDKLDDIASADPSAGMMAYARAIGNARNELVSLAIEISDVEKTLEDAGKAAMAGKSVMDIDAIAEEQKKLDKLYSKRDKAMSFFNNLEEGLDKTRRKTMGLKEEIRKALDEMTKSREEQLRSREFDQMLKSAPEKAMGIAKERYSQIMNQLGDAVKARLKAEEEATAGVEGANDELKRRFEEEKKLREMSFSAQDEIARAQEAMASADPRSMSIGFWGGDNPFEMMGGAAVKLDREMLNEAKTQTQLLKELNSKDYLAKIAK